MSLKQYDYTFYQAQTRQSGSSAPAVIPIVNQLAAPRSVLDAGCGIGAWLAEWERQGVTDIRGLDGDYVNRAQLLIHPGKFTPTDLEQPVKLGRQYDLAQCLEVAEHLAEGAADTIVRTLTAHADTILFSAAVPGQRGTGHINEQWPGYWVSKFAAAGYQVYDAIRPLIWEDSRVQVWYRQNMLLFSRTRTFPVPSAPLNIVHPELWRKRQELSFRQAMRRLPAAAGDAARKRLPRAVLPAQRLSPGQGADSR
jgi:methyltransferase family protein